MISKVSEELGEEVLLEPNLFRLSQGISVFLNLSFAEYHDAACPRLIAICCLTRDF
jgi:hypothetical protein